MAHLSGSLLLCKILTEKLTSSVFADYDIKEHQFVNQDDRELYNFVMEHNKEYGKLPSMVATKKQFPAITNLLLPSEPLDYFVKTFMNAYKKYVLVGTAEGIATAMNKDEDLDSIIESLAESHSMLQGIYSKKEINTLIPLSDAFLSAIEAAVKRRRQTDEISGASFGFDFLDKVTDGAQGGDFIVISARPKMGKTHILCNAANSAYDQGRKVMIATFEMTALQFARRLIERRTNISSKNVKFGNLSFHGEKKIRDHVVELKGHEATGHSLMIYNGSLYTRTDILAAKIDEVNPDILFVDGAYLLKLSKGNKSTWETVAEAASFLKDLALQRNIPVVATYQLNRGTTKKSSALDTIMYSDAIGQLASIAFSIKSPEEANTGESASWGSSLKRIIRIDAGREGEAAEVEVELNFGRKPFRVTRVIHGDLAHIGYGKGSDEEDQGSMFGLNGFVTAA